jgi:hypothetical protein
MDFESGTVEQFWPLLLSWKVQGDKEVEYRTALETFRDFLVPLVFYHDQLHFAARHVVTLPSMRVMA